MAASDIPIGVLTMFVSGFTFYTLVVATIALCVGAVIAPRRSPAARASAEQAVLSPLWLLLPLVISAYLILFTPPAGSERQVIALYVLQLAMSLAVIWLHRRWLWVTLPLAVVLALWPLLGMVALALGGMAH